MFSAQFGREREHDPVQVRYGVLVNNTFQRHLLNLELLLDRALGAAPCDSDQERMAFAIAEVLLKATALPPVGLVHRVLGLLWGQTEGISFIRNVVQLFTNVSYSSARSKHSMALTHSAVLLRNERYREAKGVTESNLNKDLFNTNPLLLAMAGHVCYILGAASDDTDTEEEMKEQAVRHFNAALDNAEWHGLDELLLEQEENDQAVDVLEHYRESNPTSLPAARLCVELGARAGFDAARQLRACTDYAALDSSNTAVVARTMALLAHADHADATYASSCDAACAAVLDSLRTAPRTAVAPWHHLASFAAAQRLGAHAERIADTHWQAVFLAVPRRPPRTVTERTHTLAALKAHFCHHAFGPDSPLAHQWRVYAHSLSPDGDGDPDALPELSEPLLSL